MHEIKPTDFADFFGALYQTRDGKPLRPMNWQIELAQAACEGEWPEYICLPTGAGKTSTIDIAVFALAAQADMPPEKRTAAMRTFLVVDRRTVVSEAFFRAERLANALSIATGGILKTVADRLRSYTGESEFARPLSVVEMRGGIYRDRNWLSSLTQPMIVTSTVDQVGSRLLFRGYGVAPLARPIQAAAVAFDSLIILDEAHISPAFSQTIRQVERYQQAPWTRQPLPRPMRTVEMTATPPVGSDARKLEIKQAELDDKSTHIGRIVNTEKWTDLVVAEKVKGSKAPDQLAAVLVEQALSRCAVAGETESSPKVIGIMCNMVATAKSAVKALLKEKTIGEDQVELIIGSMRPFDRDDQTKRLRSLISTGADRSILDKPLFVVATQCIEVGADYDFDVLITETAPLDALIQRFGRLNRAGRDISAEACVVMREDYVRTDDQIAADEAAFKYVDPIYGNAVTATWNWLESIANNQRIDFGIASLKRLTGSIEREQMQRLVSSKTDAPVLLPAHLNLLCQTSQAPWPDPDVSLWLHGPQRNDPEVQVCWRADLLPPVARSDRHPAAVSVSLAPYADPDLHDQLIHAVSLCPPTSAECLSVPLRRVRSWLKSVSTCKKTEADLTGDLPGITDDSSNDSQLIPPAFRPIAWRGLDQSKVVTNLRDIRPGDTLVLSQIAGGWNELGYLPTLNGFQLRDEKGNQLQTSLQSESLPLNILCSAEDFERASGIDIASETFVRSRRRAIVRLHPNLVFNCGKCSELFAEMRGENFEIGKRDLLDRFAELPEQIVGLFAGVSPKQINIDFYSNRFGLVATGPLLAKGDQVELFGDDESDSYSRILEGQPVELLDHLTRVRDETIKVAGRLSLDSFQKTLERAASLHDWGKADPRFQAILLGGDKYQAIWEQSLYAKSAKMPTSLQERDEARGLADLPKGFRHELLSLALAEAHPVECTDVEDAELLLHLIASHHGHARPWAPVVIDDDPEEVSLDRIGMPHIKITTDDRRQTVYHRIDSSVPRRFWEMNSKYGWWGLVLLETVLRLSDQRVSQRESSRQASLIGAKPRQVAKV